MIPQNPSQHDVIQHDNTHHDSTQHDIILIGGSAGAVDALLRLAAELHPNLPAAILIVIHFPAGGTSVLPRLLSQRGPLPASHAEDGEPILPGHLYVAPPDYHLTVEGSTLRLSHGPRVNRVRPAIDTLFQSAACAFGPRVIGVLLSGTLDDGTAGLIEIKQYGGHAIVQDPKEAAFGSMPANAIAGDDVDHVLPLSDIAAMLTRLTQETGGGSPMKNISPMSEAPMSEEPAPADATNRAKQLTGTEQERHDIPSEDENALIHRDMDAQVEGLRQGVPSIYSCPECGGVLWQMAEERLLRFRCHTGHVYAAQSLYVDQAHAFEQALSFAIRSLVEKATLARQLAVTAKGRKQTVATRFFEEQARTAQAHAKVMQDVLESSHVDSLPDDAP